MATIGPVEYVVIKKDADGTVTGFEYDALDDVLEYGFAEVEGEAGVYP
jgi:hypothetical protein